MIPPAGLVPRPRRTDWRARLAQYVAAMAGQGFSYGALDCALFAAGAVEAMTGADLAAGYRGRYRTLTGGLRHLRAAGYADQVALAAACFPEVPPAYAAAGDLVALPGDAGAALGIVQGGGVYCLQPAGLAVVSRLHVQRAFRI